MQLRVLWVCPTELGTGLGLSLLVLNNEGGQTARHFSALDSGGS